MPSRGLALVTVLWVLVLLSLVAASFTRTIRTEINLTRNLIDNAKAEALAWRAAGGPGRGWRRDCRWRAGRNGGCDGSLWAGRR